jgi:Holliday junction DNA helicase RuvA
MIAYIEGPLVVKSPTYVIIDVQGIGYHIHISLYAYEKIANLDRGRLLIHQVIREDAHLLFGFYAEEERELFRHLISISGIGPNTARMALSSLSPEEMKRAIIRGDISLIKSIKGIGPKSAQRIIVELQDVLKKTSEGELTVVSEKTKLLDEALMAMTMLGIQKAMAEKAIAKVLRDHPGQISIEELIKQALKSI